MFCPGSWISILSMSVWLFGWNTRSYEAASTRGQFSSRWHNLRISPAILGESSPTRVDAVSPRYGECKWGFDLVFQESSVERGQAKVSLGSKDGQVIWDNFSSRLIPVTRCPMYHVHQWDIETKSFRFRLYLKSFKNTRISGTIVGNPLYLKLGNSIPCRWRAPIIQTSTQT